MVIPGLAFASGGSGSGGAGTGPGSPGSSQNPSVPVTAGNVPVSASSGGITISTQASAFMRGGVSLTGTVPASDAGDVVEIDQLGSNSSWAPVADANAQPNGSFTATWHPARPGRADDPRGDQGRPGLERRRRRADAVSDALPAFDRDALRPRLLRTPDRLRTDPQARHDRCGQPDAPLRHAGQRLLQGERDHGAGDRPRPVCPRRQLGPDDGDRACARHPRAPRSIGAAPVPAAGSTTTPTTASTSAAPSAQ